MTGALDTCHHCGLPIMPADLVVENSGEAEYRFCCRGCQGAFRIIQGAGLGDFYRKRSWPDAGTPEGAFAQVYTDDYLQRFVVDAAEGRREISFLIEGIRCASCVWVNEHLLERLPGVDRARVNYGTHRATVRYDAGQASAAQIFDAVSTVGYAPRPYSADEATKARDDERRRDLYRFGTAAFLSMQLMAFSLALYAGYFQGMDQSARRLFQIFAAVVTTPVVFYCGAPFLKGAARSLRNRAANMDLLIAIGVLAAYFYSVFALVAGGEVYFDTAAMIVTLILAGRLFEGMARRQASAGVDRLLRLAPSTTRLVDGEQTRVVESASLEAGDLVLVSPGERFPVDGKVIEGDTEVDESAVTGEPAPVLRGAGAAVTSGTLNLTTAVTVEAARRAADSFVARIARLVEEAQARRAPVQRLADRVAAGFVPLVMVLAAATLAFWTAQGASASSALMNAIAVLVVACPCALGLATPTAVLVASGAAADRGILFRGGDIIEKMSRIDTVAFDKTGTLTLGRPAVRDVRPHHRSAAELLRLAARAESGSSHPLAGAIVAEAARQGLAPKQNAGSRAIPGRGVLLETGEGTLRAGSRDLLVRAGIGVPATEDVPEHQSIVHVSMGSSYCGCLLLEDQLRTRAGETVASLEGMGLETILLTGDRRSAGLAMGEKTGIAEVHAGLTASEKAELVENRQLNGRPVLMVGDGINDAPSLSTAEVGCSLCGGTDIALETSGLVLTRPQLALLPEAISLGRRTLRVIRQNLFWAFAYNLIALPVAASGHLLPIHAAGAMAVSSVCVVANSLRLAGKRSPSCSNRR